MTRPYDVLHAPAHVQGLQLGSRSQATALTNSDVHSLADPAEGSPLSGRHARLHLQLDAPGGRAAAGQLHEGLPGQERLSDLVGVQA